MEVLPILMHAHGEVGQARRQRWQDSMTAALRPVGAEPVQALSLSV